MRRNCDSQSHSRVNEKKNYFSLAFHRLFCLFILAFDKNAACPIAVRVFVYIYEWECTHAFDITWEKLNRHKMISFVFILFSGCWCLNYSWQHVKYHMHISLTTFVLIPFYSVSFCPLSLLHTIFCVYVCAMCVLVVLHMRMWNVYSIKFVMNILVEFTWFYRYTHVESILAVNYDFTICVHLFLATFGPKIYTTAISIDKRKKNNNKY